MHSFTRINGTLFAEDVPLNEIAELYGTPTFVYSRETMDRHIASIDGAFADIDHVTCYSVKANSNGALLRIFAAAGLGADIVSGGELYRVLGAGIPPHKIVFSGVGKTAAEISEALDAGILMFNVESESELGVIAGVASEKGVQAPISFRVNPDVDPKTHPYISTGLKKNKFGVPHDEALRLYRKAAGMEGIEVVGIDAHIGSQLTDVSPFREEAEKLAALIETIGNEGIDIRIVDIGGGLGINYDEGSPPDPAEWAEMVVPVIRDLGCSLIIEPGRSIMGNAGILLTRVLYVKRNGDKVFAVVDAAMNDLARPSLYDSYHAILPVVEGGGEQVTLDVVGPICESGDFLARDRDMELPGEGDLLAVMSAGAYGMSMSSNYNSRPRAAEVLVEDGETKLAARRETYEDLVERERV